MSTLEYWCLEIIGILTFALAALVFIGIPLGILWILLKAAGLQS